MYKLFVLDYDGTYNNEDEGSYGVEPSVYLIKIPENDFSFECKDTMFLISDIADQASDSFNLGESDDCIGDIFELLLKKEGIEFQNVGHLHITFGERKNDYLEDKIWTHVI